MSFFGALSFFFLFASIVMCIELLNRTSRFMMTQSDHYQFRIEKVCKFNVKNDKSNARYDRYFVDEEEEEEEDENGGDRIHTDRWLSHWSEHQREIFGKMRKRRNQRRKVWAMDRIISQADVESNIYSRTSTPHFKRSFGQFWASVQREAYAADLFFYLGTWSMLALTVVFLYTSRYEDHTSAEIAFVIFLVMLVRMSIK